MSIPDSDLLNKAKFIQLSNQLATIIDDLIITTDIGTLRSQPDKHITSGEIEENNVDKSKTTSLNDQILEINNLLSQSISDYSKLISLNKSSDLNITFNTNNKENDVKLDLVDQCSVLSQEYNKIRSELEAKLVFLHSLIDMSSTGLESVLM